MMKHTFNNCGEDSNSQPHVLALASVIDAQRANSIGTNAGHNISVGNAVPAGAVRRQVFQKNFSSFSEVASPSDSGDQGGCDAEEPLYCEVEDPRTPNSPVRIKCISEIFG